MIQLSNVQAIVARSSDRPFVTVPLFKIEAADGAKAFLRQWLSMTPSGTSQPAGDVPTLHFLFSWNGIEKLLRPHPVLKVEEGRKAFETFFTDPDQAPDRPAVATDLGFTAESAPQHWWDGRFSTADVDLALHCSFASSARQTEGLELIRASAHTLGLLFRNAPSQGGCRKAGSCTSVTAMALRLRRSTGRTLRRPGASTSDNSSLGIPLRITPPRPASRDLGRTSPATGVLRD